MDELVVHGAKLIFTPDSGWSWVGWDGSLALKVADKSADGEGKAIAVDADVIAMATELATRRYQAQGFSDTPGTVISAKITVNSETLFNLVTLLDKPTVIRSTTGRFTVQCVPSMKVPAPAPPVPDPGCAMRTGKWHIERSGQDKTGGNQGVGRERQELREAAAEEPAGVLVAAVGPTAFLVAANNGAAPPAPPGDSPLAAQYIQADESRYCSPGTKGSRTCKPLTSPRPITEVIIHTLAVPNTAKRTAVDAVVQSWQHAGEREVGAHYIVARDGRITQMIREDDVPFHADNKKVNRESIGIEHADVGNDPAPYTTELYEASAALVRDIAQRHAFAISDTSVRGHADVKQGAKPHGDPGPYWDWEYYRLLLAWNGTDFESKPMRGVEEAKTMKPAPVGWTVRSRRRIPDDHEASTHDPYGARYLRTRPDAAGLPVEFRLIAIVPGTYKVSLYWPRQAGANSGVPVEVDVPGTPTIQTTVDQSGSFGRWNDVGGPFRITSAATTVTVRVHRNATPRGWILADAVRLLRTGK